ncbi:outer membrane protein assembly factor BamB family protein [Chitinophaga nivalis]|uniref:PQQ-binding-like beta-propeller repeat protein n=1 Tax=Chitinophaga nivalis TaxID=2991709 RepID=A0ABT3INB2_9BACT|nr:PQQ-binding-like beta-propeller repeat protein [Chitinophaga nivalis]MCW3464853.1 PQQ-binding-like beta-propeller repeat protein [Chitinophaga nivalis]MCW3485456.1 PQQ-binding-like beta-propeller repeat protein [Chitinophaga nivalis]
MKWLYLCMLLPATWQSLSAQQLGRTSNRNNHAPVTDVRSTPAVKWRFHTGGKIMSSPVIQKERLFIGGGDSSLYALQRHTGEKIWRYQTGGAITSSVACDSTAVYFMSEDGYCYALAITDGKLLWRFRTGGEHATDTWDYFLSSPTVHNGVVYTGSTDKHLYALQARTGKLLWKYATGGAVHAAPVVAGNTVLAGSFDGYFYALKTDGTLLWKFDTMGQQYFPDGAVQFHATVADSSVYFCSRDFNVYALHLRTGKGLWVYHEPGSWTSVPSMAGKQLLVSTSDTRRVLSFKAGSGKFQWHAPGQLNIFGSVATTTQYGYVGGLDGKLLQIELATGKTRVLFQTDASQQQAPRFFDPTTQELLPESELIARSNNDYLKMYRDFLDMGSFLATPWLESGVIYIAGTDGNVYALE